MPLRLNVGLSRKVGEPDYGSRGASLNMELELDAGAAAEPERLRDRIRHLYDFARTSVEEELAGPSAHRRSADSNGHAPTPQNGHGEGNGRNGGGRPAGRSGGGSRRATDSQCRAIRAIAGRNRLDLPALLQGRFGTDRPEGLSLRDASSLIDELKGGDER